MTIDRRTLQSFDWLLLGLVLLLLAAGLANLFSATQAGSPGALPEEFRRQLAALGVSAAGFGVAVAIDYRRLERLALPLFAASLVLVASTLLFAPVVRGSRSWLLFGPFSLQPAEFAKLGLILALARHFDRNPPAYVTRLRELLRPALIAALPVGLIVLQRDLGVAVLTGLIALPYLLFVRIRARSWLAVGAVGVAALAGVWRWVLRGYQRERILDFLDPSRDPLSSGYQAIQSKIAIGSGGLFGRGWLEGPQTQLEFLPTQHSDFIFAVLAEEWGFVGCTAVLALYLAVLLWGLVVAHNAKDGFGTMLAVGVVSMLFWPAALNVAMALGLAPVVGVPLPLLSYGGSQLLAHLLALGLLANVSMRRWVF